MKIFLTVAFLAITLTSGGWAQAPGRAVGVALSPVPIWPKDGDISQLPKGQYVFYDLHTVEYVVYYAPDSKDVQSVQPTVLRFGTHSLVDPEVSSAVTTTGDGRFHYTYKVENKAHARQSIRKISLPDYSDSSPRGAGANWTAHVEPHNERDLTTPTVSVSAIEWTSNSASPSIAPGNAMQGLMVDSTSLPGFVNMTFRGDSKSNEYTSDVAASLPKEVRDQLARVMNPAWDSRNSMVIGPRFPKDTSPSTTAQNYSLGIQWLIRRGRLNADSPFVVQAQALFNEQLQAGDQTLLSSRSLDFVKQAKPGLEEMIANALEIALAQ
jgi:hypothetical protein